MCRLAQVTLLRTYRTGELPDIKIFHHGRPSNFEAAASTTNIVDIARCNAGHQQLGLGLRLGQG